MSSEQLQLKLHVPEGPVPLRDEVVVGVVLANRGTTTVVVNGRMLMAPPHMPEPFREVTFDVNGPPGYVNHRLGQVNAGRPHPEQFLELEPSEHLSKAFRLTSLHSMDLPGCYDVRATYANTVVNPALPRRPWVGRVSSAWGRVERA
jgi:hypothetical protein